MDKGVPFLTLLQRKGHIMLYVGQNEGKPVILHNTWAVKYRGSNGSIERNYIGRTVLTGLEAGKELPLINGFNLSAAPGSRNGHATAGAAQAERHGPAQPAAAASDQGHFSRVRHD